MIEERWTDLMKAFGLSANLETYHILNAAYRERHRAYHTHEHISACLRWLDDVEDLAEYPREIELALWFHDAIYKPFSKTNEADSADMAKAFMQANNMFDAQIARVTHMINITAGHAPETGDPALMLDIDLSILGAKPHVYDMFEQHIRREYRWVPSFMFKNGRRKILSYFLGRERLYNTDYFHERLETQAKENLRRALSVL